MKLRTLVAAFAAVLAAGAAVAEPSYTSQITIGGYAGEETLENFPVLVRIKADQPKGFDYSQCQGENGADISFTDAAGNVIPHEIDTWNPDGESTVWVKVPSITPTSSGATTFNFRWCDSAATESTSTSNTWDSSYVMVFHMGEAEGTCANSAQTGSKYDAEPKGTTTDNKLYSGDDAPVGGARTVSTAYATKSALVVPNYDDEKVGSNFTWSAWSRRIATSKGANVFVRRATYGSGSGGWSYHWTSSGNNYLNGGTAPSDAAGTKLTKGVVTDVWMHQVFVFDGTTVCSYRDGVLEVTGTLRSAATDNGAALGIGNGNAGNNAIQFAGSFDECRLKKGSVSAAWVKAEYDTVKTAGFLTYGAATQSGDAPLFVAAVVDDDKVTKHTATVQCVVSSLGPGATSATVKLLYWIDGDATTNTVDVGSLTEKGALTANLENLAPGTTYCVQVVATNDKSETDESAGVAFTTDTYLPSESIALGGVGGDTITVSGTVEAFDAGKTCELTVLTGDSETTITNEWSSEDFGAGYAAPASAGGSFSLSLCEADTASPRYIAPGSTVYVVVKAKIGDWVMQSPAKAVTTKNTATLKTPTWTPDQRTLKVSGTLSDLGMTGKTSVSLCRYNAETGAYEQEGEAQEIASTEDSYEFTARGEEFGTAYKFVVRATNISAGKTATNSVESAVKSFKPVDAATYTWIGRGTSGVWEDRDNWDAGENSGDCLGYPQSANATVAFAEGADVTITLAKQQTIAKLDLSAANVNVTFTGAEGLSTNDTKLTVNAVDITGAGLKLKLDGAAVTITTGESKTTNYLAEDGTIELVNGANLSFTKNVYNMAGGDVLLSGDSTFYCYRYYFGGEGGSTIINDATMNVGRTGYFSDGAKIRFEGSHPLMYFGASYFGGKGTAHLEFMVPVGGYATVPMQCVSNGSQTFGYYDGTTGTVYVDVPADAPAKVYGKLCRTTLIKWPKNGINRAYAKNGTLPSARHDKFIGVDASGADLASDSTANPISLDVLLAPPPGFLLIIR